MFFQERAARPVTEPREKVNETKRRFQIVKLEERIAPNKGGVPNGGHGNTCHLDPICK